MSDINENEMTAQAKKVWNIMESEYGWKNAPTGFHLEYFEDIVKATKQANDRLESTSSLPIGDIMPRFLDSVANISSDGLECGLEDVGITDRYEAMQYGFEQCKDRALEAIGLEVD